MHYKMNYLKEIIQYYVICNSLIATESKIKLMMMKKFTGFYEISVSKLKPETEYINHIYSIPGFKLAALKIHLIPNFKHSRFIQFYIF